jgi:hypothetical protein
MPRGYEFHSSSLLRRKRRSDFKIGHGSRLSALVGLFCRAIVLDCSVLSTALYYYAPCRALYPGHGIARLCKPRDEDSVPHMR